jgi:hypothetical protein
LVPFFGVRAFSLGSGWDVVLKLGRVVWKGRRGERCRVVRVKVQMRHFGDLEELIERVGNEGRGIERGQERL